jgi:hypothetical protein
MNTLELEPRRGGGLAMLAMKDLMAARLLVEHGLVPRPLVKQVLQDLADRPQPAELLTLLSQQQGLSSDRRQQAEAFVARESLLRAEAVYLELLAQKRPLAEDLLSRARERQQQEGYKRRLGELLIQAGALTQPQHDYLLGLAASSLNASERELVAHHRRDGFEALLPQARAAAGGRVTSGDLRLSKVIGPDEWQTVLSKIEVQDEDEEQEAGFASPLSQRTTPPPPPLLLSPPPPLTPPKAQGVKPTDLASSGEGQRIGGFQVIAKLGEGGNGVVYRVRDIEGDRECALKVAKSGGGDDVLERFKREILATSFFDHPNVIEIYDAGEFEGSYYMAMELVEGRELRDVLNQDGRLVPARALAITKQILAGLGAVHRANIVHRDLKPENILITQKDGQDFVKLMDFGIARIQGQEFQEKIFTTMQGKISGSPKYMAPEVISEPEFDQRADLYSLGIVLFEMLTGVVPFEAPTAMKFLQEHLYRAPKTLAETVTELEKPESLQRLVSRLLEKKPAARFQQCSEVIAFIDGIVVPDMNDIGEASAEESPVAETNTKQGCLGFLVRKKG